MGVNEMTVCLVNIALLFICIILINFTGTSTYKRNPIIGYRTKGSMKSDKAWEYANTRITYLASISCIIYLIINVIIALLLTIFQLNLLYTIDYIIIVSEILGIIIVPSIILEMELKKKF